MSGPGPYWGQDAWFTIYYPEKGPSTAERYINEIRRVSDMLNRSLQNKDYLVGGKYSYVDAAIVPWFEVVALIFPNELDLEKSFPHVNSWLNRIKARPAISKTIDDKAKAAAAEGKYGNITADETSR